MLNMPLHRPDKSNNTSKMPEKLKIFKLIFLVGKAYSEGFHSSQNNPYTRVAYLGWYILDPITMKKVNSQLVNQNRKMSSLDSL